jgi:hypothetical protein
VGVVAPALVKPVAAIGFVVAALGALAAVVLWEGNERRSLSTFVAAGPMRAIDAASVRVVEIRQGDRRWRFERNGNSWRASPAPDKAQLQALDDGLTLLRNAAPERVFDKSEQPDDAAVGLAPAQLAVRIDAAAPFAIDFGGPNPMGQARYARVAGESTTLLLPRYVADTWEAAAGLREPPMGARP